MQTTVILDTRKPIPPVHFQPTPAALSSLTSAGNHQPSPPMEAQGDTWQTKARLLQLRMEQQSLHPARCAEVTAVGPPTQPDEVRTQSHERSSTPEPTPTPALTTTSALNSDITAPPSSVPTAPTLDTAEVDSYTVATAVVVPTSPQLQKQLQLGLSAAETPKLAGLAALFKEPSCSSVNKPASTSIVDPSTPKMDGLKELFKQPSSAALTRSPVSPSLDPSTTPCLRSPEAEVHLMDGAHIPIPQDAKEHTLTQAYTKTETLLPYTDGDKEVLEVRQVWEERLDDGKYQVVRDETSLVTQVVGISP